MNVFIVMKIDGWANGNPKVLNGQVLNVYQDRSNAEKDAGDRNAAEGSEYICFEVIERTVLTENK
ncbi:MAG: hypothetical protein HQ488_01690 [Parcubacteria group bacterium]|nr:hypothetical protein [Parcubacteria group bacterium]